MFRPAPINFCSLLLALLLASCVHSSSTNSAPSSWQPDRFSDPKQYRERKKTNPPFTFIVVAILDPDLREIDHDSTERQAKAKSQSFDPGKAIDLMATPERIADKPLISGSLIDDKHVTSWAYSGFILEVPVENLVAASTGDLGLNEAMIPGTPKKKVKKAITAARRKFGLPSPSQLLNRTEPRRYNEVAFVGRSKDSSEVKITGAFIKAASDTGADLCSPNQCARIRALAAKHAWPVVKIFQPRPVTKNNRKSKDATEFSF